MNKYHCELRGIITKFAHSGYQLIEQPSQAWLEGADNKNELISAIKQADDECGEGACEMGMLYKRVIRLQAFL